MDAKDLETDFTIEKDWKSHQLVTDLGCKAENLVQDDTFRGETSKKPCMYQALFGISINPLALKFFGQIIISLWIQLHLRQNIEKHAFHKLFTWMSDL